MLDLSRHAKTMIVAALLSSFALAACGDDDKDSAEGQAPTIATTQPVVTEPTTTTTTTPTTPTTTTPAKTPAKVIKVTDPPRSLEAGGLKVDIEVDRVVDPVTADVDEPQEGGRFIGVFLKSRASGEYEPSKVAAVASLTTKDGKIYPVRVISGGQCEGSFFPAGFVLRSQKARTGCIGFDIPKNAVPKEIALGVRSTVTQDDEDTATWTLPAGK